ncbi:MAG TPA: hypothetical protein VIM07_08300 [Chitinophagaceae bacterium]|jgi:REP element-mobilizing transposase RayT
MPVNPKYLAEFEYENIYHIYNKTNNRELLFRTNENYRYFLQQYLFYISPIADTYSWSLLPNHFHFIIKIKQQKSIVSHLTTLPLKEQTKSERQFLIDNNINTLTEMTFKRLFTSYAMGYNKMYNRSGNLFYRTFKRIEIAKDSQFTQAIIYVNANAQKHNIVKIFFLYPWTSYHSLAINQLSF